MNNVSHRLCVAPMMDWSDRHCRYFFRLLSRRARVYSEMITSAALLHGNLARHLDFSREEHPIALQLGGSEPAELAHCARLGEHWGYDEINLNIGCPSERVQKGSFGACLMAEPELVADCIKAMQDAVSIPVTVKHRIGVNAIQDYEFLHRFVATVSSIGCEVFIIHSRNAILKGLSPKENREVPPLKYDYVYRLKRDFPKLTMVINGGITGWPQIDSHLIHVDGVMLGRAAYHDPYLLAQVDAHCFGEPAEPPARTEIVDALTGYAEKECARGTAIKHIARHALGLYQGQPGARLWRRMLSDSDALKKFGPQVFLAALREVERACQYATIDRHPTAIAAA